MDNKKNLLVFKLIRHYIIANNIVSEYRSKYNFARKRSHSDYEDAISCSNLVYRVAFEFSSKEELDKYMKEHPNADPMNHWVKEKSNKDKKNDVQDSSQSKKLYIPSITPNHKLEGDLSNIKNWKVPIMLGNSSSEDQKKGDLDSVGYVAIGIDTNEMIPIARGDEHNSGYELLSYLSKNNKIQGKKFITLFNGVNYMNDNTEDVANACKKWRDNGGKNALMIKDDYLTDFDEVIKLNGKIPSKFKRGEISKPFKRQLDLIKSIKSNNDVVSLGRKLASEIDANGHLIYFRGVKKFVDELNNAKDDDEVNKIVFGKDGIVKKMNEIYSSQNYYGDKKTVEKELNALSATDTSKDTNKHVVDIKPKAKNTINVFEDTAKAYVDAMSNSRTKPFFEKAKKLADHLIDNYKDIGIDPSFATKIYDAIDSEDIEKIALLIFSFNGVKNILHNRLRQNVKEKKDDIWFGNSERAIEEFNKLSQI